MPPAIDYNDPLSRFRLMTVSTYSGVNKAYIRDLLTGEAKLIAVGESIGDVKLIEISLAKRSARLKPADGPEFTLVRK